MLLLPSLTDFLIAHICLERSSLMAVVVVCYHCLVFAVEKKMLKVIGIGFEIEGFFPQLELRSFVVVDVVLLFYFAGVCCAAPSCCCYSSKSFYLSLALF